MTSTAPVAAPESLAFTPVWRTQFWRAPDAVLAAAGAEAERAVTRVRLAVVVLLSLTPAVEAARHDSDALYRVGFYAALVALAVAAAVYVYLRRADRYRAWTPFATSMLDVTLVSAALAAYAVVDSPAAALNSKATFDVYFLAVVAASLRYDRRACVAAGALAIAEYVALAAWAAHGLTGDDATRFGAVRLGDQAARVVMLAAATALSAEIVRRAGRLEYLSTRDRLTGLVNRGFFGNRAAAELERARRSGRPLAVAMVDVDFFKKFNDAYGHDTGDAVLRLVAAALGGGVRPNDVAARYGGEEFAILLPDTTRAGAAAELERLRIAVGAAPVALPERDGPRAVTVSAGVAAFPDDGQDAATLLACADERLYRAKAAGRNRVLSD